MKIYTLLSVISALLCLAVHLEARTKLVALPDRGKTVIRLDNPAATLIEEERILTLQKGINKIDFSWKGVQVDADSIRLVPLEHPDKVTLLNVSYPPNEDALVWEVFSDQPREERVRISYLLSFIDRLITYTLVADKEEMQTQFKSHVVLRNFSGEQFDDARVVLRHGTPFEQRIENGETLQVLFLKRREVPLHKVWTFDAAKQPWDPEKLDRNVGIPVSYEIANTEAHALGTFTLDRGKVRVFQDDGHGSTIYLGEDQTAPVPVGEDMKIYIGDSRDIVVTQRKMKDEKINIRRNRNNIVVLYDTDEIIRAELENFKSRPAELTLLQHIPGQWDMASCNMEYTRKDAATLEFKVALPANGKKELVMHYHRRNIR